jgi:hypothetical protein
VSPEPLPPALRLQAASMTEVAQILTQQYQLLPPEAGAQSQ